MRLSLLLFLTFMMTMMVAGMPGKGQNILERLTSGSTDNSERTRRINKGFEWMVQCVNILGQVENFVADRTKDFVQKLHTIYKEEDKGDSRSLFDRRKRTPTMYN